MLNIYYGDMKETVYNISAYFKYDYEDIKTEEFAGEIQKTDNYYVIVTRESLPTLPYSVEEIYGIRTSGKYGTLKQSYHEFYRIYGTNN